MEDTADYIVQSQTENYRDIRTKLTLLEGRFQNVTGDYIDTGSVDLFHLLKKKGYSTVDYEECCKVYNGIANAFKSVKQQSSCINMIMVILNNLIMLENILSEEDDIEFIQKEYLLQVGMKGYIYEYYFINSMRALSAKYETEAAQKAEIVMDDVTVKIDSLAYILDTIMRRNHLVSRVRLAICIAIAGVAVSGFVFILRSGKAVIHNPTQVPIETTVNEQYTEDIVNTETHEEHEDGQNLYANEEENDDDFHTWFLKFKQDNSWLITVCIVIGVVISFFFYFIITK